MLKADFAILGSYLQRELEGHILPIWAYVSGDRFCHFGQLSPGEFIDDTMIPLNSRVLQVSAKNICESVLWH